MIEIADMYNQARRRMEVPIITGINIISYTSLINTTVLETFANLPPTNWDKVYRYIDGNPYFATYYNGWWDVADIEPIEAGAGYRYERRGINCTWVYDCIFLPSISNSSGMVSK